MPQTIVYTDQQENEIVEDIAKRMKCSKAEAIKFCIRNVKMSAVKK